MHCSLQTTQVSTISAPLAPLTTKPKQARRSLSLGIAFPRTLFLLELASALARKVHGVVLRVIMGVMGALPYSGLSLLRMLLAMPSALTTT